MSECLDVGVLSNKILIAKNAKGNNNCRLKCLSKMDISVWNTIYEERQMIMNCLSVFYDFGGLLNK